MEGRHGSWFIAVGESCHDTIGRLYIEGIVLGFVSLDSDELIPIMYA